WILGSQNLYWMAGALFILPAVSRFFGLLEHRGLSIRREMPRAAHQGDAVTVCLHARNLLPLPKLQLSLSDDLPRGLTTEVGPLPVHLPPYGADSAEYAVALRRRGVH